MRRTRVFSDDDDDGNGCDESFAVERWLMGMDVDDDGR